MSDGAENGVAISVVVPVYNAAHLLPRVLPPLLNMASDGRVAEVLIVDDRSTDNSIEVAEGFGARVISTPENGGPGVARNLAATLARGDVLWFVDSDVIAWETGANILAEAFADPDVAAVFGSYDADPGADSWFSNYKNLLHRYYHQRANADASTFWAGCGAVRKDVFLDIGGFDTDTYRVPSIEDIELGYRIARTGGRIILRPDLLAKHLKVWTIRNGVFTDIFRRALPWSRLMINREGVTNDLNTSLGERARAILAGLLLLSILSLPIWPGNWWIALLLVVAAYLANRAFFSFMRKNAGLGFAIKATLFHQLYYVYSAGAFAWCLFEFHILRRRNRLHVP